MPLQTQSYEQLLSNIVTTWASLVFLSPNLQSGDPLLAIFQAHTLCGLIYIQSQIVKVNQLTRAATSIGADLDSWMADFSFSRLPAIYATGQVQFSLRQVSTANILIPPGVIVQTLDGSIQYQVIADTTKEAWSPSQNAYVITAGSLSCNATVQAVNSGSASNVNVGALVQIVSSGSGASFVTNQSAISNGADPETDQAFRDRFKLFINTVNARTTPAGVVSAASNIPGVVAVSLIENYDQFGNPRPGYGVVVIDDGTGAPSSTLINEVTAAVASTNAPVRGMCVQLLVIGPTLVHATITLNIRISPLATSPSTVQLNVENAVIDYVNSLEIGDTLYLNQIVYVAQGADPNVIAVQPGVLINSSSADLTATSLNVIRTDNTRVTVGTY